MKKWIFLLALFLGGCAHVQFISDEELKEEVKQIKEESSPKRVSLYEREVEVDVEGIPVGDLLRGLCLSYELPCSFPKRVKEENREVSVKNYKGKLGDLLTTLYEQTGLDYGVERGVLVLRDREEDRSLEVKECGRDPSVKVKITFKNAPLTEVLHFFTREYGYTFVVEGGRRGSSPEVGAVGQEQQVAPQFALPQLGGTRLTGGEVVNLFYSGCDPREAVQILARQLDLVFKPISPTVFSVERYEKLILDWSVFYDFRVSLVQSGGGQTQTQGQTQSQAQSGGTTQSGASGGSGGGGGSGISMSENWRDSVEKLLKPFLSDEGRISFSGRGYVVVEDRPSRISLLREVFRKERKKGVAVKVRVQIVRLDLSDEYRAGIDWNLLVGSRMGNWGNVKVSTNFAGGINGVTIQGDYRGATSVLSLLQNYGKLKLVKEFESTGRSGYPVVFTAVDRIPYVTIDVQTASTGGSTAFPQVNWEEAGLKIILVPNVLRDKVDLSTAIEVSEYKGDKAFNLGPAIGVVNVPLISKNTVSIPARIGFGETMIITGFHVDRRGLSGQGLPEISKLPVIGELFGYKESVEGSSELIFVITPERVEQ